MSEITVSVCIRGWRRATLPHAIASVLEQGREDIEVIVGDDAGDLEDVVAAFDDPRLRYRRNNRTLGLSAHSRALLAEARGKYLCLLDDDDRWLPGFLDQTISRLDADPSVGIVFTNYFYAYPGEEGLRACRPSLTNGRHERFLPVLLRGGCTSLPSATLMRRETWPEGERRRPILDGASADQTMLVRTAEAGWAFYFLDTPLAVYTIHPAQASRDVEQMLDRGVRLWERFSFEDPVCERLRRRNLSAAFLARANLKLTSGRVREALIDVRAARAASRQALGLHGAMALLGVSNFARRFFRRHPRYSGPLETVWDFLKRVAA